MEPARLNGRMLRVDRNGRRESLLPSAAALGEHRDSRSLDRYSKPRATRGALVRAFPGPCVVPGAPSAEVTELNTADISGE